MAVNKVIYGNTVLIDLTMDDLMASDLSLGKKAHDKSGAQIVGTNAKDSITTDATAVASEILSGKTAYVNKQKVEGSMPNRGAVSGEISDVDTPYSVQNGYHDGSGIVGIDATEKAKIKDATNIKKGVTILGVEGTYEGEADPTETKNVTPYTTAQTVLPTAGYVISQVNVAAIAYTETDNAAGGKTATIGTVAPTP